MSANKITERVTAYTDINGRRFYTVELDGGRVMIGGADISCKEYAEQGGGALAAVMLTSMPEAAASLELLLNADSTVPVYASAAGLRNIKQLVDRDDIDERLIKDGMEPEELKGFRFIVTPGLPWMDSVMAVYDGILFSGEMFSGAPEHEGYYRQHLAVNRVFARSALEKLKNISIHTICPSSGEVITGAAVEEMLRLYEGCTEPERSGARRAVILCASKTGYTMRMAERVRGILEGSYETALIDVYKNDESALQSAVESADVLLIGTHTINRNAPKEIWKSISSMDLVNKRRMPYLVFGSCGWSGEGLELIHKTLYAMGLSPAAKPVRTFLQPSKSELDTLEKCVVDNFLTNNDA